jgi:hypothetical protein
MAEDKRITVEEDGHVLAQALVTPPDGEHGARAQINVAPGRLPPGTRQKMADAVCASVLEDEAQHLTASVPLGDAELIAGIGEHLTDVALRAAGSTSILDGDVRPG